MSRKYYIVTEEGIEGGGHDTPLRALVSYLELTEVTPRRIRDVVTGKSEIIDVSRFTHDEIVEMLEV